MSLENIAHLSQIAATLFVFVSLVFVGRQIKQNTAALQRSEHRSTMSQWTGIRMAIAQNRDLGELLTTGLQGKSTLDAADQLRLDQLLGECTWAVFHVWECERSGVFRKGTFERAGKPLLCRILETPRGIAWWRSAKGVEFIPEFVAVVDAILADGTQDLAAHAHSEIEPTPA